MRIYFDIHSRQHITLIVCLFVVLKATEGREAHKLAITQGHPTTVSKYVENTF